MNRVYKYGCLAPTTNAALVADQIHAAHRYRNQLVEIERARRTAMREPSAQKEIVNALAADLRRGARALTEAYWGTYLLIENANDQARKAKNDPSFSRWEGIGAVAVQIQGGMHAHELADSTHAQLTTPNERGHAILRIRVGSLGRAPVWASWPIIVHRPIPAGAIIKGISVHMRRRGRKSVWSAEFSLELAAPLRTCGSGAVGVDLGWRMSDGEERVCTYASADGRDEGDLRLTAHELGGFDRVETLASTRAKLRNDLQKALLEYRASGDASPWFVEETRHLHAWRSAGKYFRLARRIGAEDETVKLALDAFTYRDTHLSDWECNQRQKNLDHRKAKYAEFAARLAAKYETIVLEQFDLRTFATRPAKDAPRDVAGRQESHQAELARAQRHEGATSILRLILRNAFERRGGTVVEVLAHDTTRTCNACGLVADRDFAAAIDWTCDCGAVHDQDVNAADNLCERWRAQEDAAASRDDKSAKKGGKRESKWSRLKREKTEKETARNAPPNESE